MCRGRSNRDTRGRRAAYPDFSDRGWYVPFTGLTLVGRPTALTPAMVDGLMNGHRGRLAAHARAVHHRERRRHRVRARGQFSCALADPGDRAAVRSGARGRLVLLRGVHTEHTV